MLTGFLWCGLGFISLCLHDKMPEKTSLERVHNESDDGGIEYINEHMGEERGRIKELLDPLHEYHGSNELIVVDKIVWLDGGLHQVCQWCTSANDIFIIYEKSGKEYYNCWYPSDFLDEEKSGDPIIIDGFYAKSYECVSGQFKGNYVVGDITVPPERKRLGTKVNLIKLLGIHKDETTGSLGATNYEEGILAARFVDYDE